MLPRFPPTEERGARQVAAASDATSATRRLFASALVQLSDKGLVEGLDPPARLSPKGVTIRFDLNNARRRGLESLCSDWEPDDPELDAMITRLAEELARTGQA